MSERPDPLAEPEGWARSRQQPAGPDLSRCSHMYDPGTEDQRHCAVPPSVIAWIGCTRGEHAGPLAFCAAHFLSFSRLRAMIHCAQCGGGCRIFRVTSMDGESTVADFGPPPGLWKAVTGDG